MRIVMLSVAATVLGLVTGCGSSTTGGAAVADHTCTVVSAPMTTIDVKTPGDPRLSIPQPKGWERTTKLDSQIIRFVMVNKSLTANNFAANAVLTFESVSANTQSPKQILDGQQTNLKNQLRATDISATDGTQCGYPATTITYTAPAMGSVPSRKAKVLGVVIEANDKTYLTTLTVGSADDQNPTFATDSATILKGFAVKS
jgi:Probable lipoprotein LpqN